MFCVCHFTCTIYMYMYNPAIHVSEGNTCIVQPEEEDSQSINVSLILGRIWEHEGLTWRNIRYSRAPSNGKITQRKGRLTCVIQTSAYTCTCTSIGP